MSLNSHLKSRNLPKSNRAQWKALSAEALVNLEEKIKVAFNWDHTPRPFQIEAIKAQLQRKDVLIHAGTGSGKTMIVAGPHAHDDMKGKVTLLILPLIALQEEQVVTFKREFGLQAIAINSTSGGLTKEYIVDIRAGKYHIVIASPEMALSKIFITQLIRHRDMQLRILSLVIDETHVVSLWGSGFRKKYGSLGILKALLPRGTPFAGMSASLSPRVRNDVITRLQLNQQELVNINLGNDRDNVSLIVRAMHYAMNTYRDLDFVIPRDIQHRHEIKKTFIYADSLVIATSMEDHLYELCPDAWQYTGFIRPYSAAFSNEYRASVMSLFCKGDVRILICTDAAGMGCNIPDIDMVVQWKLPASVSSFIQRAGRAARGGGKVGLAVLLVEKAVYEADIIKHAELTQTRDNLQSNKRSRKNIRDLPTYPKASKEYAKARGVLRGGHEKENDFSHSPVEVPLDTYSMDEGLYALVQTGMCRRAILTRVYRNDPPVPSVPCCDNCAPELLELTRPGPPKSEKRESVLKRGTADVIVMKALHCWRVEIAQRDFSNTFITGSGILGNNLVQLLSSVGPIGTMERLKVVLESQWLHWFPRYSSELLARLQVTAMGPLQAKPRKINAGKRALEPTGVPVQEGGAAKRRKEDSSGSSSMAAAVQPSSMIQAAEMTAAVRLSREPRSSESQSQAQVRVPVTPRHPSTPSVPVRSQQPASLPNGNPYAHLLSTPFHYPRAPLQPSSAPVQQIGSSPSPFYFPGYYISPCPPRFAPPPGPSTSPKP